MNTAAFWKEYRETLVKNLSRKFGYIHAYELNALAMARLGLLTIPDLWTWKKNNAAMIRRQTNIALKPLGLRISSSRLRRGYEYTEKIAA